MSDIGLPLTTNRGGSWYSPPVRNSYVEDQHAHLRGLLAPVRHRGIVDMKGVALDSQRDKLIALFGDDVESQQKVARAIAAAVDSSRMTDPMFIGCDKEDHQLSAAEQQRRIDACLDLTVRLHNDEGRSITWITDHMPILLGRWIDGDIETYISATCGRRFTRRDAIPRGLERAAGMAADVGVDCVVDD